MTTSKLRIYFASGLAELLSCAWLSECHFCDRPRQNVVVVYGRPISMPPAHTSETIRLASVFGDWDQIIDLTPTTKDAGSAHKDLLGRADEIVLHTLWYDIERALAALCPNATITLYDNGLDSHTDVPIRELPDQSTARYVLKSDLSRIRAAYYALGDMIPIPAFIADRNIIVPSAQSLRSLLVDISKRLLLDDLPAPVDRANACVLIAGTSFYRAKKITLRQERNVYANYMASCDRRIIYKEHPRAPQAVLGGQLSEGSVQLRTSIPLEFIPLKTRIERSASISSSALLMLKKVHGVEFDLLGQEIHDALMLPWMAHLRAHAQSIK